MEKTLPFFATHLGVGIAENKPNGCEEVTFSRTITTNDDVGL
jgi:hypothetical protein